MAQLLINPIALGFAGKAAWEIEDLLKNLPINLNLNRNHILNKAIHDFNEKCGEDCIIFVVNKIKVKIKVDYVNQNVESPAFESKDKCRYGCLL